MNKYFSFVLIIAIFAASCKKDEGKDVSVVTGTIVGEHANWSEVCVSFDFGETWAVTAPITKGKFSLKLPTPEPKYLEAIGEMMPEVFNLSDKNAKLSVAMFFARKGDQTEALSLVETNVLTKAVSAVQYMYVDNPVKVGGKLDQFSEEVPVKLECDMNLAKGWNTVLVSFSSDLKAGSTMSLKSGSVPQAAIWIAGEYFVDFFQLLINQ